MHRSTELASSRADSGCDGKRLVHQGVASRWLLGVLLGCVGLSACVHRFASDTVDTQSRGSPANGWLNRSARLRSEGIGYRVLRTEAEGGRAHATPRLVAMIERAGRFVANHAPGGPPLRVGDLSARRGGAIERHRSHRNGRDVDLLFFARDDDGHSVVSEGFVRYGGDGVSLDPGLPLHFDVRRNWLLVEALVRDPRAGVVWVFCADRLRPMLLQYARSQGVDAEVVARAEALLHQPGDSAPHDDHFHVRIACTPHERAAGCSDGGPLQWWHLGEWEKAASAPLDDATVVAELLDPVSVETGTRVAERSALEVARVVHATPLRRPLGAVHRDRGAADVVW